MLIFYFVALQLKRVFSAYKDVKVLQFSSVMDALEGFTDKASYQVHIMQFY